MSLMRFGFTKSGPTDPPKKKLSEEERKERKQVYEKEKRSRRWLEKWKVGDNGEKREWLVYSQGMNKMHCLVCREYATTQKHRESPWVVGTDYFKLDSIKEHEDSKQHKKCMETSTNMKAPVGTSSAEKALMSLKKADENKMVLLFRTAHALAKKSRPFSDFSWMCELDAKKGLEVGDTYTNRKQAKIVVAFIAEAEREKAAAEFSKAKFMAVLADGSTDSACMEQELVYVRYACKGEVTVQFVAVESVAKANAENIVEAVSKGVEDALLVQRQDWKKKLVAVGSDGASTWTGVRNGVVQRLRNELPHLIGIHCMAHRLELSFKDAATKNTQHKNIDQLLLGLYYFYHKSPLNRANLHASYKALDMRPLMATRVGGTRWVSHWLLALDHLIRGYQAFVQHLEQIQSPDAVGVRAKTSNKAKKYYKDITNRSLVKYACFLHDVLDKLSKLSTKLQKREAAVADVQSALASTKELLVNYKTKAGPKLKKLEENSLTGIDETQLTGTDVSFNHCRSKLLGDLVASLERRFTDIDQGVLFSTRISNFRSWPDKENKEDFGDTEVDILVNHFRHVLHEAGGDPDLIPEEWTTLKSLVYNHPDWAKQLEQITWSELNRRHGHECSNVLMLIDLVLTFPASTAECERGFNQLKQVKTDWRSSLGSDALNDLMTILLVSADIQDFDPSRAIELWYVSGERPKRPWYMEQRLAPGSKKEEEEEEGEEDALCISVSMLAQLQQPNTECDTSEPVEVEDLDSGTDVEQSLLMEIDGEMDLQIDNDRLRTPPDMVEGPTGEIMATASQDRTI